MEENKEEVDITPLLGKVAKLSLERIKEFLEAPFETRGTDEYSISLDKATVGKTMVSNHVKILQTHRAREAMQLTVCELLAKDKEQFREYVRIALPKLDPRLQLNRLKDADDRDAEEKEKFLKEASKRTWEAQEGPIKSFPVE